MSRLPLGILILLFGCVAASVGDYVWEEYEQTRAEILEMSTLLTAKNSEVVEQYGRNDTPEALAVLTPIRERLNAARDNERHLLCWDRPDIPMPREMFESMGLPVHRRRVDHAHLDAFVTSKVSDGTLTRQDGERLRFIFSMAGHEVMNPSSRGVGLINQRIAKALRCYGLDSTRADPIETPVTPPIAQPSRTGGLRYYRTCGDAVCREDGYRGPTTDVLVCQDQEPGAACVTEGERCDLANNCNMFLICARTDPATRCAR